MAAPVDGLDTPRLAVFLGVSWVTAIAVLLTGGLDGGPSRPGSSQTGRV